MGPTNKKTKILAVTGGGLKPWVGHWTDIVDKYSSQIRVKLCWLGRTLVKVKANQ